MTRVIFRTSVAVLMLIAAARLVELVQDGHGLAPLLLAVSSGYLSVVMLGYALAAAWHAGNADVCRWNRRRHQAALRTTARAEAAAVADEQQHAAAMAAVAAEPMQPQTVTYTAVMPAVVQSGVTFGFGPGSVAAPETGPWTPPVPPSARHAAPVGMPAGLAEFDWEPAGVLR